MQELTKKLLFASCLLLLFCFAASPALALELKYPSIPGIGNLEDGQKLPKEQQLGFYVQYFLRLFFFIVVGLAIIALIAAGVLYLLSLQKPVGIINAKNMAQNALLGLFILLISYTVLYVINPQLLIFKGEFKTTPKFTTVSIDYHPENEVGFIVVNPLVLALRAVENVSELVPVDEDFNPLAFGQGGFKSREQPKNIFLSLLRHISIAKASPPPQTMMYRAEIPFRQTVKIIERIMTLATDLKPLLEKCKCGDAHWHTKWESLQGKCIAGLSEKDEALFWQNREKNEQNVCLTRCKDCGTVKTADGSRPLCDVREVKKEIIEDEKATTSTISVQTQIQPEKWQIIETCVYDKTKLKETCVDVDPQDDPLGLGLEAKSSSIKYKRMKLQELAAKLEGQKNKFFVEQISPVAQALNNNAANYLTANTQEGKFQTGFDYLKRDLEEDGFTTKAEMPPQFTPGAQEQIAPPLTAWQGLLALFIKPTVAEESDEETLYSDANYYFPVYAPEGLISPVVLEQNQFVYREAGRASLFSVLTDLSLEKIEQMFRDCLTSAFGAADYTIPDIEIENIIQGAVDSGAADTFISALMEHLPELAKIMGDSIAKGFGTDFDIKVRLNCSNECAPQCVIPAEMASCLNVCIENCVKDNLPKDYISRKLTSLLTTDLENLLLDEDIKKILDSKLRQDVFSKQINRYLDTEMGRLYDAILKGGLTTSLTKGIPELQKLLDKKLAELPFLNIVFDNLQKADKYVIDEINEWKEKIASSSESYVQDLVRKYTAGKATEFLNDFKAGHPNLFPEGLFTRDCFDRYKQGYYFKAKESIRLEVPNQFENCEDEIAAFEADGTCEKIAADKLKDLTALKVQYRCDIHDYESMPLTQEMKEAICRGAGYCWSKGECEDCNWVGQTVLNRGIKAALKEEGRNFLAGLVNFGEQFISALVEVALYTATKYAEVFIEDNLIAPLQPYIKQVLDFQKDLNKLLTASVQDALPQTVVDTLNKSAETLIAEICEEYEKQVKTGIPPIFDFGTLPSGLQWENPPNSGQYGPITITATEEFSKEFGEKVCRLNKHLHTTLLSEIAYSGDTASSVVAVLNAQLEDLLLPDSVQCYLKMNLADIIYMATPLKNIKSLIDGTPKQVICGELAVEWVTDGSGQIKCGQPKGGSEPALTPAAKCNDMKKTQQKLLGTIPYIDEQSAIFEGLNDEEKTFYRFYCPFVWGACQKFPGLLVTDTMDYAVKTLFEKSCNWINSKAIKEIAPGTPQCQGQCLCPNSCPPSEMKEDANCPSYVKQGCSACNTVLNNTIAFSLFYNVVKQNFDLTAFGIDDDKYPSIVADPGGSDLQKMKYQETEAYQWLLVYFGKPLNPNLEAEIKDVALARGFTAADWSALVTDLGLEGSPKWEQIKHKFDTWDAEGLLQILVSWRLRGINGKTATLKDLITDVPLGVIKPFKPGEETLLLPAGKGESKNFLVKTPYQLLSKYVCPKIERDFKEDNPDFTYEAVKAREEKELTANPAPPYSLATLESTTIAKNFGIILNELSIALDDKTPYLFCLSLKYSPSQLLGLDQTLMSYIRPKEAQILFQLIQNELYEEEKPKALTELLSYLDNSTPLKGLNDVAHKLSSHTTGEEYELRFEIKGTRQEIENELIGLPKKLQNLPTLYNALKAGGEDISSEAIVGTTEVKINNKAASAIMGGLYFLVENPIDSEWDFEVYLGTSQAYQFLQGLTYYLGTPIGAQVGKLFSAPLIDLVCQGLKETAGEDLCNMYWSENQESINKLIALLKKKPIDLIVEYLDFPLIPGANWDANLSLMDWLAKKTVLGKKYIDTLGRMIGLDKALFGANQVADKAKEYVTRAVTSTQQSIQDTFDNVLIEAPAKAIDHITNSLAELFSKNSGEKTATQMTGVCKEVFAESGAGCKEEGKVFRELPDNKYECCDLGAPLVCKPRCREKTKEKPCSELGGEKEENGKCCYNLNYCGQCRVMNASEGGKCRESEERQETSTLSICCPLVSDPLPKQQNRIYRASDDMCCETVVECVSYKFAEHLQALADMLAGGTLPLNSLSGKKK